MGTPAHRLPPFPDELSHIWSDFAQLKATKLGGFAAQQITWAEINAYDAATGAGLSIWDKRLIRRLDDASEAAKHGSPTQPAPTSVADMRATLRAAIKARQAQNASEEVQPSPTSPP